MRREKIGILLKQVVWEVKKAEESVRITKQDANEMARVASLSPSSSGDREHADDQAVLNAKKFYDLKALEREVEEEIGREKPEIVRPICYLEIEIEGESELDGAFYLVGKLAKIRGTFRLISSESPLGLSVLGKRIGESFEYRTGGSLLRGKVALIE